ncbi:copper resistance protein CopC [Kutzneria sp. NPDC052558]|uniref:copper resistance CopC/CopD family protein n=1 Tax=Kutzneria sp. NPDC052558 TaxID=3364121 RepID=UPI0037CC6A9C
MIRALLVVFAALGWLVLAAPEAAAHASLVGTTPANGQHLDAEPAAVIMRFSERVTPVHGGFTVQDDQGRSVGPVEAVAEDDALRLPLPQLHDGVYSVTWRVVSADSHPVHGAFVFSVGTARAAPVLDAGAQAGADPLVGLVFWALRWLSYASIALLVGSTFFVAYCWPTGRTDGRFLLLRRIAWGTALGSAIGSLLVQGAEAAGSSLLTIVDPALLVDTLGTTFGILLSIRIIALLVLRFLPDRAILVVGALLAVTWSATGHDGVGDGWPLALAADSVHLLAMATWLGGLTILAGCVLLGSAAAAEVSLAADRFSRVATISVVALAVSGVVMALRDVNLTAALDGSGYAQLLLFKLAAFGLILSIAAASRSVVRSRLLTPTARPTRRTTADRLSTVSRLRLSVGGEAAIASVVLGLTAALVATSPTASTPTPATVASRSGPYLGSVALPSGGDVQVWVDPALTGDDQIALNVRDDRGVSRDVPEVTATISLPSGGVGSIPVPLTHTGRGQFVAQQITIPGAGLWRLAITVRSTDFDEATVQTDVQVR